MHYSHAVFDELDWSYRGTYMRERHGISVDVANEVVADPSRVVIDPDYNSTSGRTVRIIGHSELLGSIVTVIALSDDGVDYGVNGWLSNEKDQRIYREVEGHGQN